MEHQSHHENFSSAMFYENLFRLEDLIAAQNKNKSEDKEGLMLELTKLVRDFFQKNKFQEIKGWQKELITIAKKNPDLIVRRENFANISKIVEGHKDLSLNFTEVHGGESYPNAAIFSGGDGLVEVFSRGFGKVNTGATIFIVGFTPRQDVRVETLNEKYSYYKTSALKTARMVSGKIKFGDVKFVLVRFARNHFPTEELIEDEIEKDEDGQLKNVSRMYKFNSEN